MSEVNNEIEAFLAEVQQEQQNNGGGTRNYVSRDTLKLPISEGNRFQRDDEGTYY